MTHTIENIAVSSNDEIMVKVLGDSREHGKLDYVQFNYRGISSVRIFMQAEFSSTTRF